MGNAADFIRAADRSKPELLVKRSGMSLRRKKDFFNSLGVRLMEQGLHHGCADPFASPTGISHHPCDKRLIWLSMAEHHSTSPDHSLRPYLVEDCEHMDRSEIVMI